VCVCMCMCMCVYVCVCVCVGACVYARVSYCMYMSACVYLGTYMHIHMCEHVCYVRNHLQDADLTHVHLEIYARLYMDAPSLCMHIHALIQRCRCGGSCVTKVIAYTIKALIRVCHDSLYKVVKTYRMPQIAGYFPRNGH